jgi:hypothetical protein
VFRQEILPRINPSQMRGGHADPACGAYLEVAGLRYLWR